MFCTAEHVRIAIGACLQARAETARNLRQPCTFKRAGMFQVAQSCGIAPTAGHTDCNLLQGFLVASPFLGLGGAGAAAFCCCCGGAGAFASGSFFFSAFAAGLLGGGAFWAPPPCASSSV